MSVPRPVPDRQPPPGTRWARPVALTRLAGAVLLLAGCAAAVAAVFAPWFVSGGVRRDSLALVGLLGRYRLSDSPLYDAALTLWPLLGPLAVLVAAATLLRLRRTALLLGLVLALATGAAGGVALWFADLRVAGIGVVTTGPWAGVVAGVLLLAGDVLLLLRGTTTLEPAGRPVGERVRR